MVIEGLGVYQTYFKSALESSTSPPHVFKVSTYKSFEALHLTRCPREQEANQRWLDQLWQSYVTDVAEQREIEPDAVAPNKDHFPRTAAQGRWQCGQLRPTTVWWISSPPATR